MMIMPVMMTRMMMTMMVVVMAIAMVMMRIMMMITMTTTTGCGGAEHTCSGYRRALSHHNRMSGNIMLRLH